MLKLAKAGVFLSLSLVIGSLSDRALLAQTPIAAIPITATAPINAPKINADRTVTFRLRAPESVRVELVIFQPIRIQGRHAMTYAGDNTWTITVGPWVPDIYRYNFAVNGVEMTDPSNRDVLIGRSRHNSLLLVPATPPGIYEQQAAARGTVQTRRYWSPQLNLDRNVVVYLPPEYDTEPNRRFPVLYLRHGNGDTEYGWTAAGRAGVILENLLAAKKATPMIIVMPNGYPSEMGDAGTDEGIEATSRELIQDIIPLVENNYRVLSGRENRALAGLSAGGGQALLSGLRNLDTFAWVAAFSAQRDFKIALPGFLENPADANAKLRLLFLSCGTEDIRYPGNLQMVEQLKNAGIRHQFFGTSGDHEYSVWRSSLAELLPKLFQESASKK